MNTAAPPPLASADEVCLNSLADVTDLMTARFRNDLTISTIVQVVRRCRRELAITTGAVPALNTVEHLAVMRLSSLVRSSESKDCP